MAKILTESGSDAKATSYQARERGLRHRYTGVYMAAKKGLIENRVGDGRN